MMVKITSVKCKGEIQMDKIRYGIVGYGVQGTAYAKILTDTPMFPDSPAGYQPEHALLGAICDADPARREAAAGDFPDIPVYADYKELIASGHCDAIITTVPHFLHHAIAIYAMEQGMHIMGEKPAGIRASDVQQMIDCAAAHPDVAFGIMFNQRANKLYRKIREIVQSGELGRIRRSIWISNTWWRPDSYYQQSAWRATWGGEGGGVLVNQAPHQLDLWQWICGTPVEVTSVNINGAHRDIAVENDVTMITRYAGGATGTFITCTHDPVGTDRFEIDFDRGKIVVEDSRKATVYRMKCSEAEMNATMTMADVSRLIASNSAGGGLYEIETFESSDGWGYQHSAVLENFALHILTGSPLLSPGADGILGVRLANASQLSSWTRRTVPCPCDEETYNAELNRRILEEGKFPPRD